MIFFNNFVFIKKWTLEKRTIFFGWRKRLEQSGLSVSKFFEKNEAPFSRRQYFNYKNKFLATPSDLNPDKTKGGNRKLSFEAEAYIKGSTERDPKIKLEDLRQCIAGKFGLTVSASAISRALQRISESPKPRPLGRPRKEIETKHEINSVGGFELIVTLAYHLGWPQRVTQIISKSIKNIKRRKAFGRNGNVTDNKGRGKSGHFTKRYNNRKDVRAGRFASISEKRAQKNWKSMNIFRDQGESISRKSLAVLALPAITMNGDIRSVDTALGRYLEHLCGFDYKQASLTKYLSELKYLGISTQLLHELSQFWLDLWGKDLDESIKGPFVCYYIDGNTKAVWSSSRVKKNKVTMLGRVMGCLEHVFIHDGLGHPIYFETFSGHGPVGEHILGLFEKIENAILEVPRSSTKIFRAIVMDAAGNSVRTLRAFAAQNKYHYITPLDDNQWNERRVRNIGCPTRYRYGDATLREVEIELEDSSEKGYLVSARAIKIDWDSGKVTVLLTSLPQKIVDASEVVYSYFKRWPAQELQFKNKKAAVSLNKVAGYGRKEITNERVVDAQRKAAEKVEQLTKNLADSIREMGIHEKAIVEMIPKERRLRARSKIIDGKRIGSKSLQEELKRYGGKITAHKKAIKKIEKEHDKEFKLLRRHQKEWLNLQGKSKEYSVDVELDQILTFHRVSLANLYTYFAKHFLGEEAISMQTLISRIIFLQGISEIKGEVRKTTLQYNQKDPEMMEKLVGAIEKINELNIRGVNGKLMKFALSAS